MKLFLFYSIFFSFFVFEISQNKELKNEKLIYKNNKQQIL